MLWAPSRIAFFTASGLVACAMTLKPRFRQISKAARISSSSRNEWVWRHGPLGEETERRQRRRAGAALVWNNSETEMGDLAEIEALFFALIGGSPGAEVVFLNQNLAVRSAAVFRGFHAYFLGTLARRLLDLVDEARDRLRPVKLNDNVLGSVWASADPARGSGPAGSSQHMLDRVSRIL